MLKLSKITATMSVIDLSTRRTVLPGVEYIFTTLLLDQNEIGTLRGREDAKEVANHMFTEGFRRTVESEPILKNLMGMYDWIAVAEDIHVEPV